MPAKAKQEPHTGQYWSLTSVTIFFVLQSTFCGISEEVKVNNKLSL